MMSWKERFDRIDKDLDMTKRRKLALDDLNAEGKISHYTYEHLSREVTEDYDEIEARRKTLTEKMTSKLNVLEKQLTVLESFLAISEMAHAAEEINNEVYAAQRHGLSLSIEATKYELNMLRDVIIQLVPKENNVTSSLTSPQSESAESTVAEPTIKKRSETLSTVEEIVAERISPDSLQLETIPKKLQQERDSSFHKNSDPTVQENIGKQD
jgi:hypothetical protein